MRVNYVTRDRTNSVSGSVYLCWELKPVLCRWGWDSNIGDLDCLDPAEAKSYIGRTLKPGEIWDRRRNTIKKG